MRICLICTEKLPVPPVRGGAIQTYIDGVAPALAVGNQLTVVCRDDPALPDEESVRGVRFIRIPSGDTDVYYANVAAVLRATGEYDAVVVYNRPFYVPAIADVAGAARLYLSLHNDMLDPNRIKPEDARALLERVAGVICISDYVRDRVNQLHPGFQDRLFTVRSGVDSARLQPVWAEPERRAAARERLGLSGRQVVLHVSRFSPKKGNHLVVRAMAKVRETHPQAALLVVGSARYGSNEPDSYTRSLWRLARTLLGDHAVFTGFIPPAELGDLFLAGDLFICASQWAEPLARVHYEAMAAGLPIVTTDRGGNQEVIEEGGNGLIARPYDDPAAFASAIRTLLDNDALRAAMGARGRELALAHYSWERVGRELAEILGGGGHSHGKVSDHRRRRVYRLAPGQAASDRWARCGGRRPAPWGARPRRFRRPGR